MLQGTGTGHNHNMCMDSQVCSEWIFIGSKYALCCLTLPYNLSKHWESNRASRKNRQTSTYGSHILEVTVDLCFHGTWCEYF